LDVNEIRLQLIKYDIIIKSEDKIGGFDLLTCTLNKHILVYISNISKDLFAEFRILFIHMKKNKNKYNNLKDLYELVLKKNKEELKNENEK